MPAKKKTNNTDKINKVPGQYKCIAYMAMFDKLSHYIDPDVSWNEICKDLERTVAPFEVAELGPVVIPQGTAEDLMRWAIRHKNAGLPKEKQIEKRVKHFTRKPANTDQNVKVLENQIKDMYKQIEALSKMLNYTNTQTTVRTVTGLDEIVADLKNGRGLSINNAPATHLNSHTFAQSLNG